MDSATEAEKPAATGISIPRLKPGPAGQAGDERAWRVYQAIVQTCQETGGIPPGLRQLREICGLASINTAYRYLRVLEAAGLIRVTPGRARCIRVVGSSWNPPPAFAIMRAARKAEAA